MTQAAVPNAPEAPPAPPSVPIQLGPDVSHYPEQVRTAAEPPKTDETPPPLDSGDSGTSEPTATDAGASEQAPPKGEPAEKGTRRQKGEDAYQRGLREGREAAERERTEAQARQDQEKAQETERQRIRQLYRDLKSTDYDTREKAAAQLGDLADSTEQIAALKLAGRNETLAELAESMKTIKDLDGIDESGFQSLWNAPNPGALAKTAFDLGHKAAKSAADERIAELEAQLASERGKRVGTSLTPERQTGSNGAGVRLTLEQYQRMTPREIRAAGITSADIDALTAEMIEEAARNGR